MSNKQRGSDKLMANCTGMQGLSAEELEQVAGGYGATSFALKAFPRGIPGPEWLGNGAIKGIQIRDVKQFGAMRY